MIISKKGILNHKIIIGLCNSNLSNDFLNDGKIKNIFRPNSILLINNVNFHKTETVQENFRMKNINFDYIPSNSLILTPIKEVFSMLKMNYYNLPEPKDFDDIADNINKLIENLQNRNADFDSYYDHTRRFFDKAFTRKRFK